MTAARVQNAALVSGAATVTFTARYGYVQVTNEDATHTVYARTDGTAPSSPWDDAYYIGPGQTTVLPNDLAMWWQGQGTANPGTTVKLAGGGSDTTAFSVAGIG